MPNAQDASDALPSSAPAEGEDAAEMRAQAQVFYARARDLLDEDSALEALSFVQKAVDLDDAPLYRALLGRLLVAQRGQHATGLNLLEAAILEAPKEPRIWIELSHAHLALRSKAKALRSLRNGLDHCPGDKELLAELGGLGVRKPPPIPALHRNNPINKYLGIVLKTLRLR